MYVLEWRNSKVHLILGEDSNIPPMYETILDVEIIGNGATDASMAKNLVTFGNTKIRITITIAHYNRISLIIFENTLDN